ncbi:MAG: right-handed parallel beta-helix repeat-containing protein [Thermoplasmatota archaeon]
MKKSGVVLLVFFMLLISLSFPSHSEKNEDANIIYVDDDNTNGPWEGTIEYPFQFIQDGIDAASNTDTIMVSDGVYQEKIVINKELTLLGSGWNSTIIDGLQQDSTVTIVQDHCTLKGFQIINCSLEPNDYTHSLLLIHSNENSIENNLFLMNESKDFFSIAALQINQRDNNHISCNKFTCDEFVSEFNISRNHAIYLNGSCENTVFEENQIFGFYTAFSDSIDTKNVVFRNNQVTENLFGLRMYGSNSLIAKNNISSNRADAIIVHGGSDHAIIENQIQDNGYNEGSAAGPGIMLYRSSGETRIEGNNLIHNAGPGVYDYMSFDNVITENNFVNNGWNYDWVEKPNAFFYTHITTLFQTNNWDNNYWEPHSSRFYVQIPSELRIFAYFDSVFSIPWYAFDWHPAQEPYEIRPGY